MHKLDELILRLRHWLIKKLGGYTERIIPPAVKRLPTVTLHPERVYARMDVTYDMIRGDRERYQYFADRAKQILVEKIVTEIIANDYAVLTCEPDWQYGLEASVYTMMLCIVPPNEWMKTHLGDILAKNEN